MGLLDAFKQYVSDALPGGLLNPETKPIANRARYASGLLDPKSPISNDLQNWHKRTQLGLADQLAGRQTPAAEQAYQAVMNMAGVAPLGITKYARRSQQSATPFNDVDYAMFVEAKTGLRNTLDDLRSYGGSMWAATDRQATTVKEIQADLVKAFRKSGANNEYGTTAAQLAREANPEQIVNSAGVWDNPDLVQKIYDLVISPKGIRAISTNDGLIVFDRGIAKKIGR